MPSGVYKHKPLSSNHKKKLREKKLGKNNHQWKGGLPKCIDCGKELKGRKAKRCRKCQSYFYTAKRAPHWKGGISKNKKYLSWIKNKRNRLKKLQNKNGSFHTFGEWELLKKQYNYTCPCCKKSEPEIELTEDHVIPLSKGGSDNIENIQPLCKSCNSIKHTKIIKYKIYVKDTIITN